MPQMLDPYVMVGRTTAVYSRRDLWKHGYTAYINNILIYSNNLAKHWKYIKLVL